MKPVNTLQVEKQRGKKLTVADKLYLNELREKYIKHCNINDDADDINDDCASKKRRSWISLKLYLVGTISMRCCTLDGVIELGLSKIKVDFKYVITYQVLFI